MLHKREGAKYPFKPSKKGFFKFKIVVVVVAVEIAVN